MVRVTCQARAAIVLVSIDGAETIFVSFKELGATIAHQVPRGLPYHNDGLWLDVVKHRVEGIRRV